MQSTANTTANTGTAANAAELSEDEILILRDTDETAGAVAHLAASRLHALLTSDAEEPGVDFLWFDRTALFAGEIEDAVAASAAHITRMASYVRTRQVEKAEQLHLYTGGRDWAGQSQAYRQALDLFRVTVLSASAGMERRRNALGEAERQEAAAKRVQPLKLEDSIFEPEDKMGELLPHAVQADRDAAKARAAEGAKAKDGTDNAGEALSVGEPPAGHAKTKSNAPAKAKQPKSKKSN